MAPGRGLHSPETGSAWVVRYDGVLPGMTRHRSSTVQGRIEEIAQLHGPFSHEAPR
jgi:hypothetical protein